MRVVFKAFPVSTPRKAEFPGHISYFKPIRFAVTISIIFEVPCDVTVAGLHCIIHRKSVVMVWFSAFSISNDIPRTASSLLIERVLVFKRTEAFGETDDDPFLGSVLLQRCSVRFNGRVQFFRQRIFMCAVR